MKKSFLLNNGIAKKLYAKVKDLPIVDYHCHLSPKMIFEDKPFDNIGEIWLGGDHYKWRLMRTAGVPEELITGKNTSWHDKFIAFIGALEFAPENPLYHWSSMELSQFFNIDLSITAENAEAIWQKANAYIKSTKMSPRSLINKANVISLCTTDDITDNLEWHKKIGDDRTFKVRVLPSFRTDNLLLGLNDGYADYIAKLSEASAIEIKDLKTLKLATEKRLDYFVSLGCRVTDVGIPFFPNAVSDDTAANKIFKKMLKGSAVTSEEYLEFLGNMYLFLAKIYNDRNLVMQWHLAVSRNVNTALFKELGADCGVDCVGNAIDGLDLGKMLDTINNTCGLPKTIIYTLNPQNVEQLGSITSAFRNVYLGAAWWFCDHKRGIEHQIEVIAENSCLGNFYGMLTDSRSFLSYARHDYFRRILCNMVGGYVQKGQYNLNSAIKLVKKVSLENVKEMLG